MAALSGGSGGVYVNSIQQTTDGGYILAGKHIPTAQMYQETMEMLVRGF